MHAPETKEKRAQNDNRTRNKLFFTRLYCSKNKFMVEIWLFYL